MEVVANGSSQILPDGVTVAHLLDRCGFENRRVAVEVNGEILPRSLHAKHLLALGDRVEILQAIGGG